MGSGVEGTNLLIDREQIKQSSLEKLEIQFFGRKNHSVILRVMTGFKSRFFKETRKKPKKEAYLAEMGLVLK